MNKGRDTQRLAWAATMGLLAGLLHASSQAAPATTASAAEPAWLYRIQPGDTLYDLSAAYMTKPASWRELQRLNKVADPRKLPPGGALRLPIRLLRREASVARVVFSQGEVSLTRAPQAATPLQTGAELRGGDVVRTGEQGSLTLRFVDGSRLLLAPHSEVAIEQLLVYGRSAALGLSSMHLRLNKGSADSLVRKAPQRPPDYELRTPSLHLGVRGTEFRVQVGDAGRSTHAEVLEGVLAAGRGADALQVAAGHGVVAQAGTAAPRLVALAPAPDLRGLAQRRLERLPLNLAWPALPGARAYRAQLYMAGDFERLLLDGRFEQPQASWAALPDGQYSLRVRAIDADGLEGLAADALITLKASPSPPFSRAPAPDADVHGEQVELAWTRPVDAARYRLQLASEPDFGAPLLDRSDLSATSLSLPLPPGDYFWRLASLAEDGVAGPFSDPQRFSVKPIPPSPALREPRLEAEQLRFAWVAAPGAMRYQLQWARDAEFQQLIAEPQTEQPELLLPRPPAGLYFLRVRSVDATGYVGPYGTAQQVEIPRSRWLWLLPLSLLLLAF